MAILNSCPGLEVTIKCNKKALKEHADTQVNDAPNAVTNYVEVEADGAFELHLQVASTYSSKYGLRMRVQLDGGDVDDTLIRFGQLKKPGGHTFTGARSKQRGKWYTSNFRFSEFLLGAYWVKN